MGLLQKRVYYGLESVWIRKPLKSGNNVALAIDDERCRDRLDATVIDDNFLISHDHGIVHSKAMNERFDHRRALLVERDTNNGEVFICILLLDCHKPRDLSPARRAPGSPEIQNDNLAFEIGKLHRLSHRHSEALERAVTGELSERVQITIHVEPRDDRPRRAVRQSKVTQSVHDVVVSLAQAADVRVHDVLITDEGLVVTLQRAFPGDKSLRETHQEMK